MGILLRLITSVTGNIMSERGGGNKIGGNRDWGVPAFISEEEIEGMSTTKSTRTITMAANEHAGSGCSAAQIIGPLNHRYDARYEQLLIEELSLENARKNYLKSCAVTDQNVADSNDDGQISLLKIRGMVHRASLEGTLLAAHNDAVLTESSRVSSNCTEKEVELERSDAKHAISALWTMKSRQLEKDDNRIPLSLGSDSLAWRRQFSSGIVQSMNEINGMYDPTMAEANVHDFFCAFSECRREDEACDSDSENSSLGNDEYEIKTCQRSSLKRKKTSEVDVSKDGPVVVTCASSSPSPERCDQIITDEPTPALSNSSIRDFGQQKHQQTYHEQSKDMNKHGIEVESTLQPMRRPSSRNEKQWKNEQIQHYAHNPSSEKLSFDYEENAIAKKNPFCTAKELGLNFNDTPRESQRIGDHIASDRNIYDRNDNVYPDSNDHRRMGDDFGSNHRNLSSTSGPCGPQQMVRTAIRGPRKDISAGLQRKFQPPMKRESGGVNSGQASSTTNITSNNSNPSSRQAYGSGNIGGSGKDDEELPEELRGLDKELIEKINNEIVDSGEQVTFDDIAGLKHAKETVNELVIMPMIRPDLFTGLRACPKGLLLFGPPGTGKTLIGKAIAYESRATFFSISSSSLTSKWIGEGEKLVRTLFALASYRAPSVVFIDEVDSMLTQRKADENEASRRIKTEFLVQLDGAGNGRKGQVLVIGATNLPQELDDAARRRFVKKLYIPLPDQDARESLLTNLLKKNENTLSHSQITKLALATDGFSGADLKNLCADAAMGPLREFGSKALEISTSDLPPISYNHFRKALRKMNPSVAQSDLDCHIEWNNKYGSTIGNMDDDSSQDSDADSVLIVGS